MPISSLIPTITGEMGFDNKLDQAIEGAKVTKPGFAETLKDSIEHVDKLMKGADAKVEGLAAGKGENIHEAMIAFEKAETAMKMLVQVRNKALEAYNQIINMQV